MKKRGRRQPLYPAPPFFKTFVPRSHVFENILPRVSLFHRLFSDQESGNACREERVRVEPAVARGSKRPVPGYQNSALASSAGLLGLCLLTPCPDIYRRSSS